MPCIAEDDAGGDPSPKFGGGADACSAEHATRNQGRNKWRRGLVTVLRQVAAYVGYWGGLPLTGFGGGTAIASAGRIASLPVLAAVELRQAAAASANAAAASAPLPSERMTPTEGARGLEKKSVTVEFDRKSGDIRRRCGAGDEPPEICKAVLVGYRVGIGLGLELQSKEPAQSLGLRYETPLGRTLFYHGGLALHELGGWYGVLLSPLSLSVAVAQVDTPDFRLRLRPGCDLFELEELFASSTHETLLGAAAWVRGSAYWGPWVLAVTPLGLHLRYLHLSRAREDLDEPWRKQGLDWIMRLEIGRQF